MKFFVFSKPSCVQCTGTYAALAKRNLKLDDGDYTVVDISTDQSALDFVKSYGHQQAPVVMISDATLEELMDSNHPAEPVEHWSGYRPDAINKAFEQFPELLPEPVLA